MAIKWGELTPEEILEKAKELEGNALTLATELEASKEDLRTTKISNSKLIKKRDELIIEAKKAKKAQSAIESLGVDLEDVDLENVEDTIIKTLQAKANIKPNNNSELEVSLNRLKTEVSTLRQEILDKDTELEKEKEQRREDTKKTVVIDKLVTDYGLKKNRAKHIYELTKSKYYIDPETSEVFGGSEDDPVSLGNVLDNLRDSDDYSDYFPGSNNSSSGFEGRGGSRAKHPGKNPFAKSTLNSSEASKIYVENPALAKRLYAEAESAGEADPILGNMFK